MSAVHIIARKDDGRLFADVQDVKLWVLDVIDANPGITALELGQHIVKYLK